MYEDLIVHARSEGGEALCGKPLKEFTEVEFLLGPRWDGVTCIACNEQRVVIKTPEDLNYADQLLSRF